MYDSLMEAYLTLRHYSLAFCQSSFLILRWTRIGALICTASIRPEVHGSNLERRSMQSSGRMFGVIS